MCPVYGGCMRTLPCFASAPGAGHLRLTPREAQEEMDAEESLSTEDDTLLYEDDALDRNACMLPLVRFIEKASSLYNQGDPTRLPCLSSNGL